MRIKRTSKRQKNSSITRANLKNLAKLKMKFESKQTTQEEGHGSVDLPENSHAEGSRQKAHNSEN